MKQVFGGKQNQAAEKFVVAREDQYYKMVKAQYWQCDEVSWIYFLYLNPVIVTIAYVGGIYKLFLDIVFLYFVSYIASCNDFYSFPKYKS
jgi:hypothetical protein